LIAILAAIKATLNAGRGHGANRIRPDKASARVRCRKLADDRSCYESDKQPRGRSPGISAEFLCLAHVRNRPLGRADSAFQSRESTTVPPSMTLYSRIVDAIESVAKRARVGAS